MIEFRLKVADVAVATFRAEGTTESFDTVGVKSGLSSFLVAESLVTRW